jgi:antitoxin (DNA-binding transcriptional repressor) of toxin-antitoxin stability system
MSDVQVEVGMKKVDIRDAEANMDRLIEEAEKGKPFTIAHDGKPLVRVSKIPDKELDKLPEVEETGDKA